MQYRFWGTMLLWLFASTTLAQGVVPAPAPAPAAGAAVAPVVGADVRETPGAGTMQDQMSGKRGGRNQFDQRAPMNVRIKDAGVKLPKCVEESREGEACK